MIIACQQCSTKYEVADELIGDEGRTVRCKKCQHTWLQESEYSITDIDSEFESILSNIEDQANETNDLNEADLKNDFIEEIPKEEPDLYKVRPRKTTPSTPKYIGYKAAASIAIFIGVALITFKSPLMSVSNSAYALFDTLGLSSNLSGEDFVFENVYSRIEPNPEGKHDVLVSGTIINLESEERKIPRIQLSTIDTNGAVTRTEMLDLDEKILEPEGFLEFSTVINNIGAAITAVDITFENTIEPYTSEDF